jgi:hypothetical protein
VSAGRDSNPFVAAVREQFPDLDVEAVVPCQTGLHPAFGVVILFELAMRQFCLVVTPESYELLPRKASELWFSASVESVPRIEPLTYRPGWWARLQFGRRRLWVPPRYEAALRFRKSLNRSADRCRYSGGA